MKVILTQDVRGQGKKGQLIDAAEGYARNFLLPRKLAVLATADAINTHEPEGKPAAPRRPRTVRPPLKWAASSKM